MTRAKAQKTKAKAQKIRTKAQNDEEILIKYDYYLKKGKDK